MSINVLTPRRPLAALPSKALAGLLAVAIVGSAAVVYRNRTAAGNAAAAYTTSAVTQGTLSTTVTGTGPISAASAVPLNFKSSGKLAAIDVKVGDAVKAGQVLATEDTADLQAQLQQAQSTLASAQAAYNKLAQGPLPTDVAAAAASVSSAQQQVGSAGASVTAAQAVAAKDVASAQQALADAQKNLQSVQAQVAASTQSDKTAVANAQQALADAQKSSQTVPAVVTQQVEQAKDKLYADQVADDAAVGRGSMTKEARQAALDADQAAIDQANASAQQTLAQSQQSASQAQQALNTANANLQNDTAKLQGTLVAAQTQLNTAQSNLASTQAKDAQSVQSAQSQVASAQGALTVAQANEAKAAAPSTQADLDAAKAQVASAQAGVTLAQNNLDAAKLVAPSDATVTAVNGAVGQWITGGALSGSAAASASGASASTGSSSASGSFIDLTNLSGLQITAQVNEADVSKVQIGQPVNFTVDAFPGKTFTGHVAEIQPLGQTVSNVVSYSVVMSIDQADAQLLPGMTATANIVTAQQQNALEVPLAALTYAKGHSAANSGEQPGGSGVLFVMNNGVPTAAPVHLGISDGKDVQVLSGLDKGQQVVTGGGSAKTASTKASSASKTANPFSGGGPAGGPPAGRGA